MDKGETIVPLQSPFADKLEEIQQISLLAEKAIDREFYNTNI